MLRLVCGRRPAAQLAGMKAHWWNCVLGLLCMPAEVMLSTWTVSQAPLSIALMRLNSSAEIKCSTSLSEPMGLHLHRGFHPERDVVYLSLNSGRVTKNTTAAKFEGRIHVAADQQIGKGFGFTLRLSLLGREDTDLYYCSWEYYKSGIGTLTSNGTVIIVRERDPQEQCRDHILDLVFIALSVTAFTVVLLLIIGALIVRCTRFKKHFRPARAVISPRANRPLHVCPQQEVQHCPYLITSEGNLDFRGIL